MTVGYGSDAILERAVGSMLCSMATALRSWQRSHPNFDEARARVQKALPATSDKLKSESWAYAGEVTDPHEGRHVLIAAQDVLYEDVDALEAAIDTPPTGFESQDGESGATIWRFPQNQEGRRLAEATERLDDFDLLSAAGLELI